VFDQSLAKTIFGRLTWESFPYHEPILVGTFAVVVLLGLAIVAAVTKFKLWGWLWREWLTSVDHKKIGVMYIILGVIMLLRGFSDALMMRAQQAIAFGPNEGYLPAHHFDQVFTAHGTIMIFFVAIPLISGIINLVMPLQIGARDVAFPFLNSLSLWLTVAGALLVMVSLFVGEFSTAGWLNYVPVANLQNSPGTGPDYYLWALQIAGLGTTLSAINMVTTIIKMRAPGMTMMKMPVFCWTALCSNVLAIAIFPVLTGAFALLMLDRYVGTNFFTNDLGGNPMMYWNLV
jgi:cytochrome o ubiquinol oxidase subunit 1